MKRGGRGSCTILNWNLLLSDSVGFSTVCGGCFLKKLKIFKNIGSFFPLDKIIIWKSSGQCKSSLLILSGCYIVRSQSLHPQNFLLYSLCTWYKSEQFISAYMHFPPRSLRTVHMPDDTPLLPVWRFPQIITVAIQAPKLVRFSFSKKKKKKYQCNQRWMTAPVAVPFRSIRHTWQ